jgi:hypothetical protein
VTSCNLLHGSSKQPSVPCAAPTTRCLYPHCMVPSWSPLGAAHHGGQAASRAGVQPERRPGPAPRSQPVMGGPCGPTGPPPPPRHMAAAGGGAAGGGAVLQTGRQTPAAGGRAGWLDRHQGRQSRHQLQEALATYAAGAAAQPHLHVQQCLPHGKGQLVMHADRHYPQCSFTL